MTVAASNKYGQCISNFPNTQDFENAAVWTSGGINSDWEWGTPSKATISNAGGSSKCWIIGGLTNLSYNGSQQSYIESPCYDFSNLTNPIVKFKVFWEMEYKYDGAGLQYSINNGTSWVTLGAANEPTNCMTQNWYNHSSINYLTSNAKQGWSGNSKITNGGCQGGSGSLTWVNAKHCLGNLAGKPNIKFRFVFGSGTSCNSFDGFAIDDFTIEDATNSALDFSYNCSNFTCIDTTCQKAITYLWNFGDLASGSQNTSTLSNAIHHFSAPGIYSVTLTSFGGACSASTSILKLITAFGSSISSSSNVSCKGGNNGSASVIALYGSNCTYTWSPEGGNSYYATSLSAGNYSVFVSDGNGCLSTSTINISEPNTSIGPLSQTITTCAGNTTLLQVNTSGINEPITYLWSSDTSKTSSIYVSPTVTTVYSVIVSVGGVCTSKDQVLFTVITDAKPTVLYSSSQLNGCAPYCIKFIDESLTPAGNITKHHWKFNNGTSSEDKDPEICFQSPGIYTGSLNVTNSLGCSEFLEKPITINVFPSPQSEFSADKMKISDSDPLVNFTDLSSRDVIKWEWNFGGLDYSNSTNPSYNFDIAGDHQVLLTTTNSYGCTNTAAHYIKVLPEFTFYCPNAFTPDKNQLNDLFMPKGTGWAPGSYKFYIFDRWGKEIFQTDNPLEGWDGKSGKDETYVWKVDVSDYNMKAHHFAGQFLILK